MSFENGRAVPGDHWQETNFAKPLCGSCHFQSNLCRRAKLPNAHKAKNLFKTKSSFGSEANKILLVFLRFFNYFTNYEEKLYANFTYCVVCDCQQGNTIFKTVPPPRLASSIFSFLLRFLLLAKKNLM